MTGAASASNGLLKVGKKCSRFPSSLPEIDQWKQFETAGMEIGMTNIPVTLDAVRNLATALSKTDTSKLKHTDRLGLIAAAFGWKPDAFMHALKGVDTKPVISVAEPVGASRSSVQVPHLETLGILDLERWVLAARSINGVLIAAGRVGSGKSTVLAATAKFLDAHGRTGFLVSDLPSNYQPQLRPYVLYGEIRNASDVKAVFQLEKEGFLVLASLHAKTIPNALQRLRDLGASAAQIRHISGMIAQRLIDVSERENGVRDRKVLISEVVSNFGKYENKSQREKDLVSRATANFEGVIDGFIEKIQQGLINLVGIEQSLGVDARRRLEAALLAVD